MDVLFISEPIFHDFLWRWRWIDIFKMGLVF